MRCLTYVDSTGNEHSVQDTLPPMQTRVRCSRDRGSLRACGGSARLELGKNPRSANGEKTLPDLSRASGGQVPDQLADRVDGVAAGGCRAVVGDLLEGGFEQLVIECSKYSSACVLRHQLC